MLLEAFTEFKDNSAIPSWGSDAEITAAVTVDEKTPENDVYVNFEDTAQTPKISHNGGLKAAEIALLYFEQQECNKLFIRGLENPLRYFGSSLIGRTYAHYSAIADYKLVTQTSLAKMWMPQQKVQCVLWLTKFKSVTRVLRRIRTEWNVDPPTSKSVH
ncbi:uncharacterized protein TNCV_591811 [Trichonephila clavipes]|nr:uncharacterized protein TNCV_591811 [Trichonephila clavipes]